MADPSGPTGSVPPRAAALIDLLVDCGALTFGDFVAKSGRPTPYFVNAGKVGTGTQLRTLGTLYADAIDEAFGNEVDVLFGPAYKGIALAVAAGTALAEKHGRDLGVCFDRKEIKDHGEGGSLIGHDLVDGDRVVIVEDVTTAGTSIRESLPKLRAAADVEVVGLVVGVDRRERGSRDDVSALDEIADAHGLRTVALATVDDIVAHLRDREVNGRRLLGDDDLARMEAYRSEYGVG
jgi:orotate phosphoribosyltransferase